MLLHITMQNLVVSLRLKSLPDHTFPSESGKPTRLQCRAGIAWLQEKLSSSPARSPSMPTSPTRTGTRNVTECKLFQPDLMVEQKDSSTLVF